MLADVAVAAVVCSVVGYTIERVAYRPLRKAPRLAPLITAIGVSILLQTLAMMIWGRNPLAFPQLLPTDPQMYVDRDYILYAIGLLADLEPTAAVRIAKKSIVPAGATHIAQ